MSTIVLEEGTRIDVPTEVRDLASFRHWVHSIDFPQGTHVSYFGDIWVDMSKEQVFSHNQVKMCFSHRLWSIAEEDHQGRFFADGVRLTNVAADLSTNPDGVYVNTDILASGRVKLVAGTEQGYVELEGTPDMTLEIVSRSSVQKDTDILVDKYWKAGIPEYWLADARGATLKFTIYRHTSEGYRSLEQHDGWIRSELFRREFRLTQQTNGLGHPRFSLEMR